MILNNTLKSSGFTSKEIFAGIQGNRSFRHFHVFGSPANVLDSTIQEGKKLPTWKLQSRPCVFIRKSRNHTSNISLIYNPSMNYILLQFHIVYNDEFHAVTRSGSSTLLPNWKEAFNTDHYTKDLSFNTLLQVIINDKKISLKIRFTNDKDK